jgi:hypothetical protein
MAVVVNTAEKFRLAVKVSPRRCSIPRRHRRLWPMDMELMKVVECLLGGSGYSQNFPHSSCEGETTSPCSMQSNRVIQCKIDNIIHILTQPVTHFKI